MPKKPSSADAVANKLKELLALEERLTDKISEVQTKTDALLEFARPRSTLEIELENTRNALREQGQELVRAQKKVAELTEELHALRESLRRQARQRRTMGVGELVDHLRRKLGEVNQTIATDQEKGRQPVLVDRLEVEVKGGIGFEPEDVQLREVLPEELTPETTSTMRISMRPAAQIKFDD